MGIDTARVWLLNQALMLTGASFLFFLLAPLFGYPLEFSQSRQLLQMILPVFLAYLGTASHYIFRSKKEDDGPEGTRPSPKLLGILVRGPVIVFLLAAGAVIVAFGMSNRAGASTGTGMSLEDLAALFSAALGILAVTTNVIVTYLFSEKK